MTEFFSSAFGYLSNNLSSPTSTVTLNGIVEIGTVKLRIKKVIAEGGFSTIFAAQALDSGKIYALKRILAADNEANQAVQKEIQIFKKVSGHLNIIKFLSFSYTEKSQTAHGQHEYIILTELCADGTLGDIVSTKLSLSPELICKLFYQICLAVKHLHQQKPPIIHRDLKLENLLLSEDGRLKLCDFGSATTDIISPDENWSSQQRALLEDQLARCTTPMYRAPEMIDVWSNYEIYQSVDIWALGCILYALCYKKHPFEDSAKLAILNANFSISNDLKYKDFQPLIRGCLKVNPLERLTINDLLERLASISETNNFKLNEPIENWSSILESEPALEVESKKDTSENVQYNINSSQVPPPHRPPPPSISTSSTRNEQNIRRPSQNYSSSTSGLFSQLKGGAGSLFKNIKDTSSKVVQSVQSSMSRSGVDITYLTSRLAVMSYPGEGLELTTNSNCAEDVRALLESKHHITRFSVYNVSRRSYPTSRIGKGRLVDCCWNTSRRMPPLHSLYAVCQDMYRYLDKDRFNVCVVHCMDGKSGSAVLVSAFLLFVGFVNKPEDAAQLFAVKRTPPNFQPSEIRYLKYFNEIVKEHPYIPHFHPMKIISVTMEPVPLFNKSKDGCRPYVEVYQGEERILSTQQEYEKMMMFNAVHGKVILPLNISVAGDITIMIYHARHILGRPTGIKILQYQFHTGFLSPDTVSIICHKKDLDDLSEGDYYQTDNFILTLTVEVSKSIQPYVILWENHSNEKYSPKILFSSKLEADEMEDAFASKPQVRRKNSSPPPRPAPPRPPPPSSENIENNVENALTSANITEVDLLNLSPAPHLNDNNSTFRVDLLNINDTTTNQPANAQQKDNLLDIDITQNTSDVKFQKNNGPDVIDLLGDLGCYAAGSANCDNSETIKQSKMSNMFFDPFDFTPSASQDTLFSSTACSINLLGGSNGQNPFPLNPTSIQRNISTPNLCTDVLNDLDKNDLSNVSFGNVNFQGQYKTNNYGTHFSSTPMSPVGSPVKQNIKSPCEPNYSRSHFDNVLKTDSGKPAKSKSGEDIFGDLLGSQGYSFTSAKSSTGPRTINEMRKEEMVKEMDPVKLKVHEWKDGKKGNIRALLCSMHTILWEGATFHCEMHQLISPADVKKAYRKACLAVHPDKLSGSANEALAKLIFVELNKAWSDFEQDASQQSAFRQ